MAGSAFSAAPCSGIDPSLSLAAMSAPRSRSKAATAGSALYTATKCSGIQPSASFAAMSAPRSRSTATAEASAFAAASNNASFRLVSSISGLFSEVTPRGWMGQEAANAHRQETFQRIPSAWLGDSPFRAN